MGPLQKCKGMFIAPLPPLLCKMYIWIVIVENLQIFHLFWGLLPKNTCQPLKCPPSKKLHFFVHKVAYMAPSPTICPSANPLFYQIQLGSSWPQSHDFNLKIHSYTISLNPPPMTPLQSIVECCTLGAFIVCHTPSFTDLDLPRHFLIASHPPHLASVRQTLCNVGIMGCKIVCLFWCMGPILKAMQDCTSIVIMQFGFILY